MVRTTVAALAVLALGVALLGAHAAGNAVDRYMVRGYVQVSGWGWSYTPGQVNPPVGEIQVAQTGDKAAQSVATVDVLTFPSATQAVEVWGSGDVTGTVSPTSPSFSTPGSAKVAVGGAMLVYEYSALTGLYEVADVRFGTLRVTTALRQPTSIDNVRERSASSFRAGATGLAYRTRSDYRGRFGYNPSGTAEVVFVGDDDAPVAVLPAATPVVPEESRMGFVQSGTLTIGK